MRDARAIAETILSAAVIAGIGYGVFAVYRLRVFERRLRAQAASRCEPRSYAPAVTILKPVHGDDPGLEENLESFCLQDFPAYDVVFGALDPADPALDTVRRVAARFPGRTTIAAGDGTARHRNPKMATLDAMMEHARGALLVVADSDMRVTPGYLDAVVAPFADPRIGAATCMFRGEPATPTIGSLLGAMALTEQFMPSALVANAVEPMTYCFGSTMAVRSGVLREIGGIAALGVHLADDYALGQLVTARGYRIALAPYVVENRISEPGVAALLEHELRWARTVRAVRLASYVGTIVTYPFPLALAYLAIARRRRAAWLAVTLALAVRLAIRHTAHRVLGMQRRPPLWLVPVRDLLAVAIWAMGLRGGQITWRGVAYEMAAGGLLDGAAKS